MSALAALPPMVAKLIPRLATNHDGEVVATVRAIERTLKSAGLDFHELASRLGAPAEPRIVYRDREAPKPKEPASWEDIAKWCRDNDRGRLKTHERNFVADMASNLMFDGQPSEKQGAWLRSLYTKLKREGAT